MLKRKILVLIFGLFLLCGLITWWGSPNDPLPCYSRHGNVLRELDDGEPVSGRSIFFHESSCPKAILDVPLNSRQACSIESTLRAHSETDVFLLISTTVTLTEEQSQNALMRTLLESYPNFRVRHIDFARHLSNTPMAEIEKSGALKSSQWPMQHASDILRYTTLYKFSGTYLDLDVIVLKPFMHIRNFASAESDNYLGAGLLNFDSDDVGREIAKDCAEELSETYKSNVWGYNGPELITRIVKRRCNAHFINETIHNPQKCRHFSVFPAEAFMPISFSDAKLFFECGNTARIRQMVNQSYTIHFWNKVTASIVLNKNQDIPFLKYAEIYCPKIYETVNGSF